MPRKSSRDPWMIYAFGIALAIAAAILLRAYVLEVYRVPSQVMTPTLIPGDILFVKKWRMLTQYSPKYGDVVVYRGDLSKLELIWIKRVVGIPGDSIEIKGGRIFLNEKEVPFQKTSEGELQCGLERHPGTPAPYQVCIEQGSLSDLSKTVMGENELFLIGDYRVHGTSQVDYSISNRKSVLGIATVIWLSIEKSKDDTWPKIRWDRVLSPVNEWSKGLE